MKKCGGKNPITALDGAWSRAYLDTEIDRRAIRIWAEHYPTLMRDSLRSQKLVRYSPKA
jgi:hypothetical protein